MTLYNLKPRFQALLTPLAARLASAGVTANQVTLATAAGSLVLGGFLAAFPELRWGFLLIPVWLFVRMALNAIDGIMARRFHQESALGRYLNEIADGISDAAIYLPFAFIAPFDPFWVGLVIFLALLSEFAGVLGLTVGASRRYDGPMGKSDRAVVFAGLAVAVAMQPTLPGWLAWAMPGLALAVALTVGNRIRRGLAERRRACPNN